MSEAEAQPAAAGTKPDRILLIGRRNGAVAAARRCGLRPVVIEAVPRPEQAPSAFGGSRQDAVAEAIARFAKRPPAAVAAVATGSVMAAAAIREHFGLSGLPLETARRCHDKLVMKKAIAAAGLPCAPWRETDGDTTPEDLVAALGLPVVLKMPISSGGRGVRVCRTVEEVRTHLQPGWLAEGFVEGTEMSVESFRSRGATVFRNQTRYLEPGWANVVPAGLPAETAAAVDELAEQVHEALGIHSGISHMELFLTAGGPVFGEIAARPPGGYLMTLLERAHGFDPWEALVRLSLGETFTFPSGPRCFAGVWIIHPGPGTVRAVEGLREVAGLPGVTDVTCSLQPGDVVEPRKGTGGSKGRIIVEGPTPEQCASTLRDAARKLRVLLA